MIPALARWNGDHAMTKDTTKEAAAAAEGLLFDDWFDAIEDGVRARVRGFIETMLEEELCEALSRPRYGRRRPGEDAAASVVGVRHGHRERTLTGTFGKTRIAVPRARLTGEDGKTREWRSGSPTSAAPKDETPRRLISIPGFGPASYFPAQNCVFLVTWLMARAKQIPPEAVRQDAAMRVEGLAAILC